jgi:hypothetical protein
MPAKKTQTSKSAFIRAQPATLLTADVIAKAKDTGMTIRPGLVYEVRRAEKAKKAVAKKTTSMGAKNGAASKSPNKQSKGDFVRAHANLSPQEIAAKAKAEGIKLAVGYVHNVRSADRAARKKKRTAAAKLPASTPAFTNGARPSVNSNAENLLKAVAAEIGLGRAMEILSGERARVRAVIGG